MSNRGHLKHECEYVKVCEEVCSTQKFKPSMASMIWASWPISLCLWVLEIFQVEVHIQSFVYYRPYSTAICKAGFNGLTDLTTGFPSLDCLHSSTTSFKYLFPTMAPTRTTGSSSCRPSPLRRSEHISRSHNHRDSQSDVLMRKMASITCFFEQDVKQSRTVSPP